MDLRGLLRASGLEKYEAAFRENEIDDTVLPTVTAEEDELSHLIRPPSS